VTPDNNCLLFQQNSWRYEQLKLRSQRIAISFAELPTLDQIKDHTLTKTWQLGKKQQQMVIQHWKKSKRE
jgi:hypothetical protein